MHSQNNILRERLQYLDGTFLLAREVLVGFLTRTWVSVAGLCFRRHLLPSFATNLTFGIQAFARPHCLPISTCVRARRPLSPLGPPMYIFMKASSNGKTVRETTSFRHFQFLWLITAFKKINSYGTCIIF